jgi:hypothetical protein
VPRLTRRTGLEVELLAPRGCSRRALADELARRCGGTVHPVWHADSEPSLVPELGRFRHLTQGFEVRRPGGELLVTLVDDVTLRDDLDPTATPRPGWYRVLTDDPRLLSLLARRCDPGAGLADVLAPAAALWGGPVGQIDGVYRLDDARGATIALAAPQGSERERPCELVTPPLTDHHGRRLEELLGPARELGFTVPREAAVHLHVDGAPFRNPRALANVVRLFAHWREPLRALVATNPACRRLAALPAALVAAADAGAGWDELRAAARSGELTKFFDVNLTQLFAERPIRDTVEIRILPGAITAADILSPAMLLDLLLERCLTPAPFPTPAEVGAGPASAPEALLELAAQTLAGQEPAPRS